MLEVNAIDSTMVRRRRCATSRCLPSLARSPACWGATASARPACSTRSPASSRSARAASPSTVPTSRGSSRATAPARAYVPQAARSSRCHRRGDSRPALRRSRRGPLDPGRRSRCSVLNSMLGARRRPVRRPAAAAGDRPCAGHVAEAPAARRAHGGIQPSIIKDIGRAISYFAQSGEHRGRWSSSIRLRARAGRPFRRDGPWRDRLFLHQDTMDEAALKRAAANLTDWAS